MTIYTNLIIGGWIFVIFWTAWVFYRWWSGKNHLITYWNLFVAGSINFVGFGMIQNALGMTAAGHIEGGYHAESWIYLIATYLFYLIAGYIYYREPKKTVPAPITKQWWPEDTTRAIGTIAILLSIIGISFMVIPFFPGAQIFYVAKGPIAIAAFFLGMFALFRVPFSPFVWAVVAITLGSGLVVVLSQGGGRRELLALLICIPAAAYWQIFRHKSKKQNIVWLGGIAAAGLIVISSYATIRHTDRGSGMNRTQTAVARIKKLPAAVTERAKNLVVFGEQGALIDAQNGVWAGMLVINLTTVDESLDYDILHCLKFIVVNPVPRSMWPDKPEGLGKILPVLMGEPRVTWGPTITGHCFYDGGWPVVIFYALLVGGGFRFLDRRIAQDPTNPWQLAMLISVSGHIIGLPRGDCGTFVVNILWGIIFVGGLTKATLVVLPRRQNV